MPDWIPRVFTQTFGVVGAILEKDGAVLLVKEVQENGPDNSKWSHPAGWIDVGEEPIEAVKREVLEETGHDFTPTHLLGVYSLVRKDVEKELNGTPHAIKLIFIGTISDNSQALHEDISEIKWFKPEEIYNMGPDKLRDVDIKQIVKDYFGGQKFSLEALKHTVVEPHES
jgi:phosphatase NudJ